MNSTLFALHSIIDSAIATTQISSLGPSTRAVLLQIGRLSASGRTPCIGDIVDNRDLGSPVTNLKRLRELEAAGWIKMVRSPHEHRAKEIHLCDPAIRCFDTISQDVQSAIFKGISSVAPEMA